MRSLVRMLVGVGVVGGEGQIIEVFLRWKGNNSQRQMLHRGLYFLWIQFYLLIPVLNLMMSW